MGLFSGLKNVFDKANDFLGSNVGGLVGKIGGGLISNVFNSNARNKINQQNADLQREFSQNSISWRVQDAKNAGIHPLFALGASTISAQPSFVDNQPLDFGSAFHGLTQSPSKYDKILQEQTLKKNELELQQLALENERIRKDTALMGQNVFNTGVSSQKSGGIFTDNTVGGVSNEFNSRWSVSKNANGDWQKTPTNDFADLMSEGYVTPAREYARDLNPFYQRQVANDLTASMHKSGDLPKNKKLVPSWDFSGIIPEVVYKEKSVDFPRNLPKGEYERTPRSYRFGGLK